MARTCLKKYNHSHIPAQLSLHSGEWGSLEINDAVLQEQTNTPVSYLLKLMSSCSCRRVVGWSTHFPLSISTRMSSSKSIFLSVAVPLRLRLVGAVGQRSVNNCCTAAKPVAFLRDVCLEKG